VAAGDDLMQPAALGRSDGQEASRTLGLVSWRKEACKVASRGSCTAARTRLSPSFDALVSLIEGCRRTCSGAISGWRLGLVVALFLSRLHLLGG
jgi:hypothetical protein